MTRRVLVVEDDADTRLALAIRVRTLGVEVLVASDGAGAVASVQRDRPDLVLLDLGIPGGDGHAVLERLRRLAVGVPVIVLTARAGEADRRRAVEAGATEYLTKPVEVPLLLETIRRHLPGIAQPVLGMPAARKILVVEDDADTRLGLQVRLRAAGFDVVAVGDAVSAMARAVHEHPDAVLLDLGLPGGDGLVVLQRLRSNPNLATIPVLVLSARDPATHASRALAAGATAYLQKPADNDKLIAAIRAAIGA